MQTEAHCDNLYNSETQFLIESSWKRIYEKKYLCMISILVFMYLYLFIYVFLLCMIWW